MSSPSPFWSEAIRGLSPYVPGEQPRIEGLVKLNTNENPYPPSPAALAAIAAATGDELRLYPDPDALELRQTIAAMHGLPVDHVFVGNGSDEVLAHAFLGLLKHARPILFPDITYSFYPAYCGLYGIAFNPVPLDETLQVRVDEYLQPNGGIVLPNPNAPTGTAIGLDALRFILAANRGSVVLIDEAYVDFGADSAVALIAEHPNLLVVQTLSKSRALAGMRVGVALGSPPLMAALEMVKGCFNSYPLDRLALVGATAALRDQAYFERMRTRVMASRERLAGALRALGFEVLPSQANFVFARHPAHAGAQLQRRLREARVLVRHFDKPRIDQYLRITVGTDVQCDALLAALRTILATPGD